MQIISVQFLKSTAVSLLLNIGSGERTGIRQTRGAFNKASFFWRKTAGRAAGGILIRKSVKNKREWQKTKIYGCSLLFYNGIITSVYIDGEAVQQRTQMQRER